MFGTPVTAGNKEFGKLERILIQNNFASQFTVDPGFFGYEKVLPLEDVQEATADRITLRVSEDAWDSYTSYADAGGINPPPADTPYSDAPETTYAGHPDQPVLPQTGTHDTVDRNAAVLSSETTVVDVARNVESSLRGLVVDSGRPRELVLDDGRIPFDNVSMLADDRLEVRGR